jgi:hypothetical protein
MQLQLPAGRFPVALLKAFWGNLHFIKAIDGIVFGQPSRNLFKITQIVQNNARF